MRGIGDPRGISVLARLPERGLRGCAILAPKIFLWSSYSGAAGRGGGIGSGQEGNGASAGRGRGGGAAGRPFAEEEVVEEQRQSNADYPVVESAAWRFVERRNGAQTQSRGGSGGAGAGRGRGILFAPPQQQESAREEESEKVGRGRGTSLASPGEAGRGRGIPAPASTPPRPPLPRSSGGMGRGILHGGNVDVSGHDIAGEIPQQGVNLGAVGSEQGTNSDPSPSAAADEPKQSAVEKLLSKLGQSGPDVSLSPRSSAPDVKPRLPFRMPFARPPPLSEQQQPVSAPPKPLVQAQTPIPLASLGRGRGQPGAVTQPGIGAEPEVIQAPPRRVDRMPEGARRDPSPPRTDRISDRARRGAPRPPSPPRLQLSVEEARARAISILEEGIEKNLAAEGERRRKAGMDKFADATEFLTDRFNRAPGQSPSSQPQRPRDQGQRPGAVSRRSDRPRRQRSGEEEMVVSQSAVEVQLTPEQEAQLVRVQEEDTFKDRLHTLFLAQFEPEFAMEEFGKNPDIDEPPVFSLEEYLQSYKPMFLHEDAELSEEQKWQEAVKTSLANAPDLEKLVEAYGGPGRITARQQIEKLQTISQKLPPTVAPEVAAFTHRAFLTLQNNPRLNMHQKEKLMTNIVSGFSSN